MSRISKLAMSAILTAGLWAGAVSAQTATGGEAVAQAGSGMDHGPSAGMGGGAATGGAATSTDQGSAGGAAGAESGGMTGEHSMSGKITAIDKAGHVTLKTGAGNLRLHFPPDSLQGLKKGDTITVHLSFSRS